MFEPVEKFFEQQFGKKVTEEGKDSLIPKEGDRIFNLDTKKIEVFTNGVWIVRG